MSNSEEFIISNITVYAENHTYQNGYVKVGNGRIVEVGPINELVEIEYF